MQFTIDLYSDTKTQPTAAMRRVIAEAVAGDEQHLECPIVAELTTRTATLLGQEAAIFLPSGTMANGIAVLVQCRPGDELIVHHTAHHLNFEAGSAAGLAGTMVRPIDGAAGQFDAATLAAAIRPEKRHLPRSRMVSIEQTTNIGGGTVWPLERIEAVANVAHERGLVVHLDGARLMNAVVASSVDAGRFGALCDTVSLDFTKGLGCPFGAVLAGSAATIDQAWRWKQRLGGSMRQAGMFAAACIHALDHHVERLADDHANARLLAHLLGAIDGLRVMPVETNMVFVDVADTGLTADEFNARLAEFGIRMSIQGGTVLRAVTHLGVDRDAIETTAAAIDEIVRR